MQKKCSVRKLDLPGSSFEVLAAWRMRAPCAAVGCKAATWSTRCVHRRLGWGLKTCKVNWWDTAGFALERIYFSSHSAIPFWLAMLNATLDMAYLKKATMKWKNLRYPIDFFDVSKWSEMIKICVQPVNAHILRSICFQSYLWVELPHKQPTPIPRINGVVGMIIRDYPSMALCPAEFIGVPPSNRMNSYKRHHIH